MSKLSDEQKQAALEAGKQGMKDAYEKSKTKTGLKWWERLLWVVLAGAAAEKDGGMQGRFLPGAGAGAYLLFPGPAGNGRSARRSIPEKVKP